MKVGLAARVLQSPVTELTLPPLEHRGNPKLQRGGSPGLQPLVQRGRERTAQLQLQQCAWRPQAAVSNGWSGPWTDHSQRQLPVGQLGAWPLR